MKELTSFEGLRCANCGTPLKGEFCHHCGQSVHSVLKPIHAMGEEAIETLFHIDGRIVHTLPALFLKPGFLTLEYFSGRRVRYIAPFRLMFVLSLLAFFLLHLGADAWSARNAFGVPMRVGSTAEEFQDAATPADVREQLNDSVAGLEVARQFGDPTSAAKLQAAEQNLRQSANKRLLELHAAPMPAASLAAPATAVTVGKGSDESKPNEKSAETPVAPVDISWLPNVLNRRLTAKKQHLVGSFRAYKNGDAATQLDIRERWISNTFTDLPPTMLVMMPLFAALLSLFYVFKRRLYMEHLIVALHSHAFLFLSLMLITVIGMLSTWLRPHFAPAGYVLGIIQAAAMLWVPIYLLIMQKRVYRQSWPMTLLKYWFIGWLYFWLLACALTVAFVLGITH